MIRIAAAFVCLVIAMPAAARELTRLDDMAFQSWNAVEPGGHTTCSDGSPYRFYAMPGARDKLAVFFNGGGACWSAETCDPLANSKRPLYTPSVAPPFNAPGDAGIFNDRRADNPLRGWTVVVAPYCTGDVHIGARRITYTLGKRRFAIEHKGAVNAQAVLNWTFRNVQAPKAVLVTGSSAGAIGAAFHAGAVARHYRTSDVSVLADAAGAYRTPRLAEVYRGWGIYRVAPAWMRKTRDPLIFEAFIRGNATEFPHVRQAQYNYARDAVQAAFLHLLGGADAEGGLRANLDELHKAIPSFRSYTAAGTKHTILGHPELYTTATEGVVLRQWVADFVAGKTVRDADCKAEGCAGP